jgi:DNA gyrase subunit B
LDEAALFVNPEAPPISGPALETLVTEYRSVQTRIERLSRIYPSAVMQQMIHLPALTDLASQQAVNEWALKLSARLDVAAGNDRGSRFEVAVVEDAERQVFIPEIHVVAHGVSNHYRLNQDFFSSSDYLQMTTLGEKLDGLIEDGGYIKRGEKTQAIDHFSEALNWLMGQAEKGYSIQRYKGLGEMNPEQLWETTMDPSVRRMLQVRIEDAIAADQIFTCLMGDAVEPRRDFIEENALKVANLDI